MKALFLIVLVAVLVIGFLVTVSPGKAEAWHRSAVSFSVVVPPFGVSIGAPAYYYPGPIYGAPPYPIYASPYYSPYYAYYSPYYRPYYYPYGPYFRYRHWGHRSWRGDWHGRGHWR